MSSRQRRVLVRRHKDAIIAWKVQARMDGWSAEQVSRVSDFKLAVSIERYKQLPADIKFALASGFYSHTTK